MSELEEEIKDGDGDPSVPTELLEIHLECEDHGITPEQFKEAFGS